ncbi:alginate lyase family protein [Streptomyces sp. NPDC057638]|uniref:alginate lyase family protein n=1 Tax=Streptomyces sp. NPDC057638 TaxID=3346190 RepID=UPI003690F9DC
MPIPRTHLRWAGVLIAALLVPTGLQRAAADPGESRSSVPPAAAPAAFTHPGVVVSTSQLDFARTRVAAGAEPWKSAFDQMMGSAYASLSRPAKARAVVECGPSSNPNNGCTDERQDALAAYTTALAWYVTRDERYARKSIEIMDAWSAVIKDHTHSNAPLQAGWAGSSWPKAAEIIRYTYSGAWPQAGRFATMLRTVYLPEVIRGSHANGNWEMTMMEAAVGISVHLEDRASYDRAMATFRTRAAAYVYLPSDGPLPRTVPGQNLDTPEKIIKYWHGQDRFVAGVAQETCRDFGHTGWGLSAMSHIAETSRIQGDDLYRGDVGERLRHGLGFHARYQLGEAPPSWLCGGAITRGLGAVTEIGYTAMHLRLGFEMPNTRRLNERNRPAGANNYFTGWETLTHGDNVS